MTRPLKATYMTDESPDVLARLRTALATINAAVLREYYLSKPVGRESERAGRFCDVFFLDLDTDDSFFLAIETSCSRRITVIS